MTNDSLSSSCTIHSRVLNSSTKLNRGKERNERRKMAAALQALFSFSMSFWWISMALLWCLCVARVDARNGSSASISEVQTLSRFKYMTAYDTWVLDRGYYRTWNDTDKSPCYWWGVTCTRNLTVESLDLSGWGLTGLPSLGVLSTLPDLRKLDLSANSFRGKDGAPSPSIPEDIGSLVGLYELDLSRNPFSGPIPSSISACRSLRSIHLDQNALTGVIPDLSTLENLQFLYLSSNQLSGPFPQWLAQLPRLLVVKLSGNALTGKIPSLPNLTSLLEISLDNNAFTGFQEPVFPDSKSLVQLTVNGNQMEGPIPASITDFLHMRILDLSTNRFTGQIPTGFSLNMSEAITMDLSFNQLSGNIPPNLLQPTTSGIHTSQLVFSNNLLTGQIPFIESQPYHYDILDFSNNKLSGSIPSICNNGSSLIKQFWLQNNELEGEIVKFLAHSYSCVVDLQLANNSFSGDLSRITTTSETSMDLVRKQSILNSVDLSNNSFWMSKSEANPDPLRVLLEYFVLGTSVTLFRISGNNFTGTPLPASFSVAANSLLGLDLSHNYLTGEISDAAFNSTWFPVVQSLNLSNNDLTGRISEAIVMLPKIVVLDLTNNTLSGPLPLMLPASINPSLFAGNDGLCGGPLGACTQARGFQWWILVVVIVGCIMIAVGSCLVVTWRWRVYRKIHQQDADLIKTLLDRESASLMSLRELKKATNNFAEDSQIGEGGFGIVYTGKLNDGTRVAIKRSKFEGLEKDKERFLNEIRILCQVSHRHLVKLLGCCMENKIALLVFEFVSNGTLKEHLQGKMEGIFLSWKQRVQIAIQTADALNYLHTAASFPIYHRDVKSANILLDQNFHAKVGDFGLSRLAPLEVTHVTTVAMQGTVGYIDPEYYASCQLNDKSDVFSFGVVLLELISAKPVIDFTRGEDKTSLVNFASTYIENGDLEELIDQALLETYNDLDGYGRESILDVGRLALKCLQIRSKARPSMHEVWKELQNMWLALRSPSKDSRSTDDEKNDMHNFVVLLSDSSNGRSSRFSLQSDDIEMSTLGEFCVA